MDCSKQTILIADDSVKNRSTLMQILKDGYKIMEAYDGQDAVDILRRHHSEIDLILLDTEMPKKDGFQVLTDMNHEGWINNIPVIMISSEGTSYDMRRAYGLGVSDYISRPFDSIVVRHRIINTIRLYSKQKKLVELVVNQIYEKEKNANLMVTILGHLVEFRNGESGAHVLNVRGITKLLLERLVEKTEQYHLSYQDILLISMASTLHDIGKFAIPDEILNKNGKLTEEEFEIMKSHSMAGVCLLEEMTSFQEEPLIKTAYKVCRWHHERYDGRGYPDGLRGDDIPIAAQVVGMADAYDSLTSERIYKKAVSHEEAIKMILDGECGIFNPLLLECLKDVAYDIQKELKLNPLNRNVKQEIRNSIAEYFSREEITLMENVLAELD